MNPANAYVRELVQSGALGEIMRFTGTYDQDQLLAPTLPITWRHINKLAGYDGCEIGPWGYMPNDDPRFSRTRSMQEI